MTKQKNILLRVEDCQYGYLIAELNSKSCHDIFYSLTSLPIRQYKKYIVFNSFDEDFFIKEDELIILPTKYLNLDNWIWVDTKIAEQFPFSNQLAYLYRGEACQLDFEDFEPHKNQITIPSQEDIDNILEKITRSGKESLSKHDHELLKFYSQKLLKL